MSSCSCVSFSPFSSGSWRLNSYIPSGFGFFSSIVFANFFKFIVMIIVFIWILLHFQLFSFFLPNVPCVSFFYSLQALLLFYEILSSSLSFTLLPCSIVLLFPLLCAHFQPVRLQFHSSSLSKALYSIFDYSFPRLFLHCPVFFASQLCENSPCIHPTHITYIWHSPV